LTWLGLVWFGLVWLGLVGCWLVAVVELCRLKVFCKQLIAAGTLWFLVTPFLVLLAPMFPKVMRHRIITSGTITLQTTALHVK
jgi:hypothetical protein